MRGYEIAAALRSLGWRATVVPPQLSLCQRERIIRRERPDLLLLQQARHPLNRPDLYSIPCVFDIDDADWCDPARADAIVACCRQSAAVIAGSRAVAEWCGGRNANTTVIWTGTPMPPRPGYPPQSERGPVVAWAHSSPLGYPHEAALVRDVLVRLAQQTKFDYWVYGVAPHQRQAMEPHLAPIRSAGVTVRSFPFMPYGSFLRTLQEVAVGLQPVCSENPYSQGKSFGKVLAYVASGVPVVASDAVDHPLFFRDGVNGFLAGDGKDESAHIESWVTAVRQLLEDPARRQRIADAAYTDGVAQLSTESAALRVDGVLRSVLQGSKSESANDNRGRKARFSVEATAASARGCQGETVTR